MTTAQITRQGTYTVATDAEAHALYPCDHCGMGIVKGERVAVSNNGLTVEHTACVRDWFRRNYGREGL